MNRLKAVCAILFVLAGTLFLTDREPISTSLWDVGGDSHANIGWLDSRDYEKKPIG
jgi:hypothetical protein